MLEAFSLSDKGCVRANNEDYCLIDAERGLYVLADGMGGAKAGERASRMAVETVAEIVPHGRRTRFAGADPAAEEANRRVLEAAHSDPSLEGMGTTLVAALELEGELAIASVGDSRAYVLDDHGLARHHRRSDVGQRGRPAAGARRGEPAQPPDAARPDHGDRRQRAAHHQLLPRAAASGNLVLICSDGLHGVLEAPQMEQILQRRAQRRFAGGELPQVDRGGQGGGRSRQRDGRADEKNRIISATAHTSSPQGCFVPAIGSARRLVAPLGGAGDLPKSRSCKST